MKQFIFILSIFSFLNLSCNSQSGTTPNGKTVEIKINQELTFQTIHNFGASDAWSCQFVGNWPEVQKNKVADLLFSLEENEDGSLRGIGLSCWRFNIGGGSADVEDKTGIDDSWRRAESFLQPDGTYNWQKQSGQRWFLNAAQQRGVETFIGFVNSPPVALTKNGKAFSSGGNSMNLTQENLPKYSDFLVEVTKNIQKNEGVLFDYLSPVNEPQWDWKGGQEGSPWTNNEIAELCRILGPDLKNAGLSTQIEITEAGQLNHFYEKANDVERGFQIEQFFSPASENYVGDVPNMAHKIAGHSYFTTTNNKVLKEVRTRVKNEINRVDSELEFWMSEFCILGDNDGFVGNGRDLGMETALFVANVIHADLTVAGASAWHWWLAVSPYDFKDGLVYIDKSKTGGRIYDSKLLWGLGNFSRFIRPGAERISVETNSEPELKASAYKNKGGDLVLVVINQSAEQKAVDLHLEAGETGFLKVYETSESNNLQPVKVKQDKGRFSVPAKSISTVLIK
ncbi:glycoside hydrolase family 30 protein [Maribellus comscasis]|nr:glycoside hydrolase family 30 protein [Maribellus comscasis]